MIKIELTVAQKKQLEPLFEAAKAADVAGSPGAIAAQIWPDGMCVMFLGEEKGRALSTALGGNFRNTCCTARAFIAAGVPPNAELSRRQPAQRDDGRT